ncbi:MAG: zinc ribbon domain-containing protein [Candidatus Eisenbacteria bacterium]|jgi:putative FmdB family regulatory protein|nr:zinc ribbon domain-containing protein [Candidatus Eisenbacteria bacterium]
MPTYEYECGACGDRFERRQQMSDAVLTTCPACGGTVRRVISGGGGILVNSGDQVPRGGTTCSLEQTGSTCCGRDERCGAPPCGKRS